MAFFRPLVVRYSPVAAPESVQGGGRQTTHEAVETGTKTGDINLTNIVKLIPGDVVAVYLAARGVVTDDQWTLFGLRWPAFLTAACLLVCVFLRYWATRQGPGGPNWVLIVVTCVAFFIWAHAVYPIAPGPIVANLYGSVAGVFAMLFGIVAPKLVPAAPDP